jgi:hypothetical protein
MIVAGDTVTQHSPGALPAYPIQMGLRACAGCRVT